MPEISLPDDKTELEDSLSDTEDRERSQWLTFEAWKVGLLDFEDIVE